MENKITVEVAYATPERQLILEMQVAQGTTAAQAVRASGITREFPQIDLAQDAMGIFSRHLNGKDYPVPEEYVLLPGDRVEIYRPLLIDPKAARAARVAAKRNTSDK